MVEKKEVFEKIKAKFEKTSQISDRTINETLEPLMTIVTEGTTLEDFLKIVNPIFETIAGNLRKDVAEAVKNIKVDKPNPPKDEPKDKKDNPSNPDEPAWLGKLMSKFEEYDRRFEEEDKRKSAERIKANAIEKVSKLYPKNVIEVVTDGFNFNIEDAETAFIEKVGKTASKFGITPEKGANQERKKPNYDALLNELRENDEMLNNNN